MSKYGSEIEITRTSKGLIISVRTLFRYSHTEFGQTEDRVKFYTDMGYSIKSDNVLHGKLLVKR